MTELGARALLPSADVGAHSWIISEGLFFHSDPGFPLLLLAFPPYGHHPDSPKPPRVASTPAHLGSSLLCE